MRLLTIHKSRVLLVVYMNNQMPFTIILKGINRKFKQRKYYNIILEVRYLSRRFTKMMNTLTVKGVSGDTCVVGDKCAYEMGAGGNLVCAPVAA